MCSRKTGCWFLSFKGQTRSCVAQRIYEKFGFIDLNSNKLVKEADMAKQKAKKKAKPQPKPVASTRKDKNKKKKK
jgi:hypothetical protein